MDLETFDDEKYYRNTMKSKKFKKTRRRDLKEIHLPKSKPKSEDYHLLARKMRAQKRTQWYSKIDSSA